MSYKFTSLTKELIINKNIITVLCIAIIFVALSEVTHAEYYLRDGFDYADGSLVTVSGGLWKTHSGTTGEIQVTQSRIYLDQAKSEDVNRLLESVIKTDKIVYASMNVEFSVLPKGKDGSFFAHFKDKGSNFRGRVFACTNGVPNGKIKLGVSSGTSTASVFHSKLISLNEKHQIVIKYNSQNCETRLWIDPVDESDEFISSEDIASAVDIYSFAFRQNSGIGGLYIDDLIVAGTFEEVVHVQGTESPPVFVLEPQDCEVFEGMQIKLSALVSGAQPLYYNWYSETGLVAAATDILKYEKASRDLTGNYYLIVSNYYGAITSRVVSVKVNIPTVTEISQLRSMLDKTNYVPTDTSTEFYVEGIIIFKIDDPENKAVFFFVQDDTGGIAVKYGSNVDDYRPVEGDLVRIKGYLGHSNGLLSLSPDPKNYNEAVFVISGSHALPECRLFNFLWKNDVDRMESIEGSLVKFQNVFIDQTSGVFESNKNIKLTDFSGNTFSMKVTSGAELVGMAIPSGPVNIIGVLAQNDSSNPRTSGYELWVSKTSAITPGVYPPTIVFTNYLHDLVLAGDLQTNVYEELVLRPGEALEIIVKVQDPEQRSVNLAADLENRENQQWNFQKISDSEWLAIYYFRAGQDHEGRRLNLKLYADNGYAISEKSWSIYVPTKLEQSIIINEFLANPTSNPSAVHYNPLHRKTPSSNPSVDDEFIEIVNSGNSPVDLLNWTVSDAQQVRFRFEPSFILQPRHAVVLIGGYNSNTIPDLTVPFFAANVGSGGLSLNNTGTEIIHLRNGNGDLVMRVVYSDKLLSSNSSLTRVPDLTGAFSNHLQCTGIAVSPGLDSTGNEFYRESDTDPDQIINLRVCLDSDGVKITWDCLPGCEYSVLTSDSLDGEFKVLESGLKFSGSQAIFCDWQIEDRMKFYKVTSP